MGSLLSVRRLAALLTFAVLFFASARVEAATSVTVAWDASSDTSVTGYLLLYGTSRGAYTGQVDVGNRTQFTLLGLPAGTYYFVVKAYNATQVQSAASNEVSAVITNHYLAASKAPDFDGDRRSDLAVWRASTGAWDYLSSSTNLTNGAKSGTKWGSAALGDVPLSGDLDGDGVADLIVWRASTGTWYWLTSSSNYTMAYGKQWGNLALGDKPMLADIDGDAIDDLIIWRASTGTWYWLTSSSGYDYAVAGGKQWGQLSLGDMPMTGDFDGDGRADLAIWRASNGTFYWLNSSSGYAYASAGAIQWGNKTLGDIPLLGDFDGDHRSDLAVWRASTGTWYWVLSSAGYSYAAARGVQWGNASVGDVPAVADMDGDGRADIVVWRASSFTWYWLSSSSSYSYAAAGARGMAAGSASDVPIVK